MKTKRKIAIVKLYAETRDKLAKRRDRQRKRSIADVVEDLVNETEPKGAKNDRPK